MDTNNLAWSLQPGSKRPSPSPHVGDREVKMPRRVPPEGTPDDNDLDIASWQPFFRHPDVSQQNVYQGYESQYGPGRLCDDFTLNEIAYQSFGSIPTNSLYPLSGDVDIPMGNTPCRINQSSIMPLEETSSWMDFKIKQDLLQITSDEYASILPRSPFEVDISQQDSSIFDELKTSDALSRDPAAPGMEESLDICNDYDTCFGVIKAIPTSSHIQNLETQSVSVKLKSFGSVFMFHDQHSGSHLGILSNSKLVSVLNQLPLRLDATLFISDAKATKEKRKPQTRKYTPTEPTRECSIRIVVYGLRDNKEVIGGLFSDAGFFLQHPSVTEVIPGVHYDNPHYLVRPGAEMPRIEDLKLDDVNDVIQTEASGEINKSRFMRIFDSAEANGGAITAIRTLLSLRLRSRLMRHQVLALAMMQEKESGFVEKPIFPPLWTKGFAQNNTEYYRHTITGSLEPKPIPVMGGIIADDMGLGKTLSMLALICSSLDLDSTIKEQNRDKKHQGTLIVAPKSTIYGWMAQISEHIHDDQVRVKVYHGPNRGTLADQFQEVDVVITTYETLRTEWAARQKGLILRPLVQYIY